MPRRVVLIVLIALVSLGLLFVHPTSAQTAKSPASITTEEAASLRGEMERAVEQAREEAGKASTAAEWAKTVSNTALTVTGLLLGIVALFSIGFTWVSTRRIRDYTDDAKEFRNRTEGYMKEASQVIEEMESRKAEIDEDIEQRKMDAVEAIDEKRDQAADFNRFFMEGFREFEQGNYKASLKAYEQALAIDEESATACTNKGAALLNLGRHEEALEASEKAIGLDPELAPAWGNKGGALFSLGRHEEALEASEKAIGFDLELALAWVNKSAALLGLGRNEEGLEATEKGIELDPNNDSAWYNKACAHSKLGQKPEMLDALKRAIELDPDYKEKAKTDDDFEPYRDDPDFRALVFGEEQ